MDRRDLSKVIAKKTGLTHRDAQKILDIILTGIKEYLARGEDVELRGLGSFKVKERASTYGRNLSTGEKIPVPSRRQPVFIPGKVLKRMIN